MDVERAIQFILEAQAQQAATLQAHAEALRRNEERIATVTDLIGSLAQAELRLVEDIRALRQAQADTDERAKASDERLNLLIDIVDKIIRRDGHGQ